MDYFADSNDTAAGCSTGMTTMAGYPYFSEFDNTNARVYADLHEEKERELWMLVDRREWREYLKSMWLGILRAKQYFNTLWFSNCKLYYRRLLFSISGWLARSGYSKKN